MTRERSGDDDVSGPMPEKMIDAAADLILANEILTGPVPLPDLAALHGARRIRPARRVYAWGAGVFAASGAISAAVVALLLARAGDGGGNALSYVVDGAAMVAGDLIEAPSQVARGQADSNARANDVQVRFSDGSVVTLDLGARLQIPRRHARGAEVRLNGGRALFAIEHRAGTHWQVDAGPFAIDVTGTRFSAAWDEPRQQLEVRLEAGSVVVRGGAAGPGVTLRPGDVLVASARDQRVTVQRPAEAKADLSRATGPTAPDSPGQGAAVSAAPGAVASGESGAGSGAGSGAASGAVPPRESTDAGQAGRDRGQLGAADRRRRASVRSPATVAIATPGRDLTRSRGVAGGPSWSERRHPELEPPPVPPSAPSILMGAGGTFCLRDGAAFSFERSDDGLLNADSPAIVQQRGAYHLALSRPTVDRSHSWCGSGSLRMAVDFHDRGRPTFSGRFPNQSGLLVVRLPRPQDFTDKTVSLHVFIDGPPGARLAGQLFVVHHGKWINGPVMDHLAPGRWWTVSHQFRAENPITVGPPYPPGGTSLVTDCDRIALILYATGGPRTWSGTVYVDDIGWR